MKLYEAAIIFRQLSDGTNPVSGKKLRPKSVCNNREVVLALLKCKELMIDSLDKSKHEQLQAYNVLQDRPINHRAKWTPQLKMKVAKLFEEDHEVDVIAKIMERTPVSIKAELEKQGYEID